MRLPLDEALGHFQTADARQVQVTQHHIRLQPAHFRQGQLAAVSLTDHLDIGLTTEDHPHTSADKGMIIEQVNPDRHLPPP